MNYVKNNSKKRIYGGIALIMAMFSLSIGPIVTKTSDAPGIVCSFFRMAISAVLLTPVILMKNGFHLPVCGTIGVTKKVLLLPIVSGIVSAFDHSLWATAVKMTTASSATLLNSLAPVWIAMYSIYFLKERYSNVFFCGMFLVIICSTMITGTNDGISLVRKPNFGDILAVLSSFFYAGYFLITRLGSRYFSPLFQMYITQVMCSVVIGLLVFISGYSLIGYSYQTYVEMLFLGVFCQTCGYYCLTIALSNLSAVIVSIFTGSVPMFTAILAWVILHESLSMTQLLGCFGVLIGITIINQSSGDKKSLQNQ